MEERVTLLPPSAFQSAMTNAKGYHRQATSVANVVGKTVPQFPPQARERVSHGATSECFSFGSSQTSRESQLSAQLHVLEEQLQSRTNAYKAHIAKLEGEMRSILEEQQKEKTEHRQQIKAFEDKLSEKSTEVEQLKCYVTESSAPSTQMCKKQLEEARSRVQVLEKEKRELENSVELLNIRVKSHDQIQNIQDSEVSEAGDVNADKKKQLLLKRWRMKVYELLVQLQSQELLQRKEQQVNRQLVLELENACANMRQQLAVLQHALEDKQASLDMQLQHNKSLESELKTAENLALDLDNRSKGCQQTVASLAQFAQSLYASFMEREEAYSKMSQTLQLYNQRVTFASGRVEMLQSQFARRDALLRVELQKQSPRQKDDAQALNKDRALFEELQQELDRLAKERDSLAKQSKEDALILEHKLAEARQENERQLSELKEENTELRDKLQLQSSELASALESLEASEMDKNAVQQAFEQLQTRLEEMQGNIQQEIEKAYEGEQVKHRQEVAELQQKLSDAGREHSKTVVSLRQLERQIGRERERMSEQIKSLEEHNRQHIVKLENNVKELEKERNLLMTTLRQEGLVGKHRAARSSPVTWLPDQYPGDVTMEPSFNATTQEQRTDVTMEQSADVIESHQGDTFEIASQYSKGDAKERTGLPQTKDTFFEDTADSQQQEGVELADVIEEVKKLSEEVMDEFSNDSDNNEVTQ